MVSWVLCRLTGGFGSSQSPADVVKARMAAGREIVALRGRLAETTLVTKGRRPDAHDVELLRALAPDAPIMDMDELACDVIKRR